MASTIDRQDYFRPNEWKAQYPNNGSRFVYFTYEETLKSEYRKAKPPYTNTRTTTRSYYMKAPPNSIIINKGYQLYEVVDDGYEQKQVLRAEGTFVDLGNFPYVRRGFTIEMPNDGQLFTNDHKIKTLTITDAGFARYCSSTSADGSEARALYNASNLQSGTITFTSQNGFSVTYNEDGSIKKITGECQGVYRNMVWTEYDDDDFEKDYSLFYNHTSDPENPPEPFKTWEYKITATFYTDYEEQQGGETIVYDCPQLYEAVIPTDNAWTRDDDGLLTLSNKLPKQLEWARPYPYGKWYRDSNGELRTRGLPEILVDTQGAFNECPNLIYVKIPESVKSIGRYAFRDTNLKSVKIANDCTYYPTSFPIGCKIYFYGGGSPAMTDIRSLEGYTIGEIETKTINEMEGN